MQRTNINPEIYQEMLESAANAGLKGQAAFFAPTELGQLLAKPLPRLRTEIVDLNCGAGHLLRAAANLSTTRLFGCDIDPCRGRAGEKAGKPESQRDKSASLPLTGSPTLSLTRITADLTRLYPLLVEVDWLADLMVLNPPWDLHFYRDRLVPLADSSLAAVRAAFAAHDGRTSAETIDSTIAVLLIALDRLSTYGEGFLIANNATLQRLIFDPGAPHGALSAHVWAHLVIQGNPMTGEERGAWRSDAPTFHTGVIYFARAHHAGVTRRSSQFRIPSYELGNQKQPGTRNAELETIVAELADNRTRYRRGAEVLGNWNTTDSLETWQAVAQEWKARKAMTRSDYNLWLAEDGTIQTALSLFDRNSSRILKEQANRLYALNGKRPMQLVLQRNQREELLKQCGVRGAECGVPDSVIRTPNSALPPWRADPKLRAAVEAAVKEYHACRAPLYPLPELQRLGYLDEEDFIVCKKELGIQEEDHSARTPNGAGGTPALPTIQFRAGSAYPLATKSVTITRRGVRPNLEGELEDIEFSGQELAILIQDETGKQRVFMEGRLRDPQIIVPEPIDFTLHDLATHFTIPDVPDISQVDPLGYEHNLKALAELEAILSS